MRTLVIVKNGIASRASIAGMDANAPHAGYNPTPPANEGQDGGGNERSVGGNDAPKSANLMLVSPDYMDLGEDSRESTGFSETPEVHPAVKSLVSADYGEDSSESSASAFEAQRSSEGPNTASLDQISAGSMPAKSDLHKSGDERYIQAAEQSPVTSVVSSGGDVHGVNVPVHSRVVQELLKGTTTSNIASPCVPVGTAETERGEIHSHFTEPCKPGGESGAYETEDQMLGTTLPSTGAVEEATMNSGTASKDQPQVEPTGIDSIANIPLPLGPPPAVPAGVEATFTEEKKASEGEHAPSSNTALNLPPEAAGLPPRVVSILLQGQEHLHSHLAPSQPDVPEEQQKQAYDPAAPTPVDDHPLESQGGEVGQEAMEKNEEEPMDWDEAAGQTEGGVAPVSKVDQGPQDGIDLGEESNLDLNADNESQLSQMETAESKTAAPVALPEEVVDKAMENVPPHLSGPVLSYPSERDNSNIPPSEGKTPDVSSDAPSQEPPPAAPQGGDEPMEESNTSQKDSVSWCRSDVAQFSGGAQFKSQEESQASSDSQGFHPDHQAAEAHFPTAPAPSADSQPGDVAAEAKAAAPTHDFGADIRAAIHPPKEQEGEAASSSQFLEDDSMAAGSLLQDEESMLAGDSSLGADEESRVTADSSSLYPGEDSVAGEESMSLGGEQGELQRKRKLTYDSVLGVDEESQAAEDANFPGLTGGGEAEGQGGGEGEGAAGDAPPSAKRPRRDSASNSAQLAQPAATPAVEVVEGVHVFLPENLFEYQWPQDGGEWHMLQEQISEYLGVLSFKRKYPDLSRRTVEKQEKEFLREKGVVSETQCDLGLTALRSEEVYDLMHKDYPEKYQEYANVLHERQKQTIKEQHKEYEVPKLEKGKMAAYIKKAAKSAAEFNLQLQRERKEERRAFFDLQTFTIQYPKGRFKVLPVEKTNTGAYPVALLPGQYQNYCAYYTSDELRYLPLNTVMFDPPKRVQNKLANPAQAVPAESSEEADSAEDKNGSASASDSDGSGSSDSDDSGPEGENGTADQQTGDGKPEEIKCRVCTIAEKKGKDGKIEILVKCSECKTHGHPTCLDLPKKMVEIITTYPWQCMECKTCIECMDPYDEDKMMFCDRCDRGYHTFCVGLRSIPTGRWECKSCKGSSSSTSSRSRSSSRRSRH